MSEKNSKGQMGIYLMVISPVIIKSLLQLALLLVHIAKVGVCLRQQGVLLDGQGAEVSGLVVFPALEMDRTEQQENTSVRWILNVQVKIEETCKGKDQLE